MPDLPPVLVRARSPRGGGTDLNTKYVVDEVRHAVGLTGVVGMITHGDSGNLAQNPFDLHGRDVLATNLQHVLALPIPLFDPTTGLLPESEHRTGWDEIRERFGWNVWRRQLLKGLCEGLAVLAAAGGEPTPPASVRLPLPQPVEPTTSINRNVTVPVGQS